jgi:hypothetical protein
MKHRISLPKNCIAKIQYLIHILVAERKKFNLSKDSIAVCSKKHLLLSFSADREAQLGENNPINWNHFSASFFLFHCRP